MAEKVRLGKIGGLTGVPSGTTYGLWIGDGGIVVVNDAATVIIDGTSNMFKIAASGSISVSGDDGSGAGGGLGTASVTVTTGQDFPPGFDSYMETLSDIGESADAGLPKLTWDISNGFAESGRITDVYRSLVENVPSSTTDVKFVGLWETRLDRSASTVQMGYFIFAEAAL